MNLGETIILDVTRVVSNWILFLDSLLGTFDEHEAFKLYNLEEDTLFYEYMSEDDKYVVLEYLEDQYISPLNKHMALHGYEVVRVIESNIHKDPNGTLAINLIMRVRPISPQDLL